MLVVPFEIAPADPALFTAMISPLQSLIRHWRIAAGIWLAGVGFVVLGTWCVPESYRSQAGLYFRVGRENSAIDTTFTSGSGPLFAVPTSRDRELNSILEILRSRAIAEQVFDHLGFEELLEDLTGQDPNLTRALAASDEDESTPRDLAVYKLLKAIKIKAADDANVIWVTYEARKPEFAQRVVQQYVDVYLESHMRFHRAAGTHAFLELQTQEMVDRLARTEEELMHAQEETQLIDPVEQRRAMVELVAKLEGDLLQSESSVSSLKVQLETLQQKLSSVPAETVTERTSGIANNAADKMREQLFALQVREQELLTKYTSAHPDTRAVREQIKELVSILAREQAPRVEETLGVNHVLEAGQMKMLELEPQYQAALSRQAVLRQQLDAARVALDTLGKNEMRMQRLKREVDLSEAIYQKYVSSLDQARLDEALENQRISNVSVIQPPTLERKPVSPIWPLNLALAVVGSSVAAYAVTQFLDQARRGQEARPQSA